MMLSKAANITLLEMNVLDLGAVSCLKNRNQQETLASWGTIDQSGLSLI